MQMKNKPGRKEQRKVARQAKKTRRKEYFSHSQQNPERNGPTKRQPQEHHRGGKFRHELRRSQRVEEDEEIPSDDELGGPQEGSDVDHHSRPKMSSAPPEDFAEMNEDELEIARLEAKLGINKKNKKADAWKQLEKGLAQDGFDEDLMDFLKDADKFLEKDANAKDGDEDESEANLSEEGDDLASEEAESYEDNEQVKEASKNEKERASKRAKASRDAEDDSSQGEVSSDDRKKQKSGQDDDDVEEYDPLGDSTTMYLPSKNIYGDKSASRDEAMHSNNVTVDRVLDSKVRSLLNRCSPENASRIVRELLLLFDSFSPGQIFDSLTRGILESSSPVTSLMYSAVAYAIETSKANLISHIMEKIVLQFDKNASDASHISLLGNLCALGACSTSLMFQLCEKMLEGHDPQRNEEMTVAIANACGWKMRSADPNRFKQIISTAAEKFDSDILGAHAKNRHDYSSEEDRVKKWRKFVNRECKDGASLPAPLNVSYQDFLQADEKGRWWILGAAWTQNGGAATSKQAPTGSDSIVARSGNSNPISNAIRQADKEVLRVAQAQGMETDVQKAIFCCVMTADDHVHAFDQILKLHLSAAGERQAVRVILKCCEHSKRYNPFFAMLASRLCASNASYAFSFKLAIWDDVKGLDVPSITTISAYRIVNLARFVADLMLQNALGLSILKAVNFIKVPTKEKVTFLKELFICLLLPFEDERANQGQQLGQNKREGDLQVAKVFSRLKGSNDGALVRDGILVFWSRTEPFMHVSKSRQPVLHKRLKIAREVMEHYVKSEEERRDEEM